MDIKEEIKKITEDFLKGLGVPSFSVDISGEQLIWKISIETSDEHSIVGRDGDRLEAFSHLLKRMIAKKIGDEAKVSVDVNHRQEKNEEILKTKATIIADRARSFKKDIEMDPMSSYERMVVHTLLEGSPNIKTESVGMGKDRRLVIRYVEDQEKFEV